MPHIHIRRLKLLKPRPLPALYAHLPHTMSVARFGFGCTEPLRAHNPCVSSMPVYYAWGLTYMSHQPWPLSCVLCTCTGMQVGLHGSPKPLAPVCHYTYTYTITLTQS
jgi:hypothetical protein